MQNKFKDTLSTHWPIYIVILIQFFVFNKWLLTNGLFTNGDWGFYVKEALISIRANYFSVWLPDNDFGRVLIDVGQAPTYAMYGLIAKLFGLGFGVGERFVHFLPIVFVASISIYLLLNLFIKNKLAIFCGMLVFLFNTYTLTLTTGHLTLGAAFAFTPLITYFFVRLLREPANKFLNTVACSVTLAICSFYEPRSALIVIGILVIYFLYHSLFENKDSNSTRYIFLKNICLFGLVGLIFALLNLFWILGLAMTPLDGNDTVLDRGLFGSAYFTLQHALSLHQPYWNGKEPVPFLVQVVPFYFWLTPLVAGLALYWWRSNTRILFFALLSITGILLAKQTDAPFTGLYSWLYTHIPGFNAFREASKFYAIIVLAYAGLVAFSVEHFLTRVNETKFSKVFLLLPFLLISTTLYNTMPFLNNSIGSLFVARQIPEDYIKLNELINSDKDAFKTLYMPLEPRWATFGQNHQKLNLIGLFFGKWKHYSEASFHKYDAVDTSALSIFDNPAAESLFETSSIKYVVVPLRDIDNDDDFFIFYGDDRKRYLDKLNTVKWLKRIEVGTKAVVVYENSNYKPYFSSSKSISQIGLISDSKSYYNFEKEISDSSALNTTTGEINKKEQSNAPRTYINDIFDVIDDTSLRNRTLLTKNVLDKSYDNNFYSNKTVSHHSYRVKNGVLSFFNSIENALSVNNLSTDGTKDLETSNTQLNENLQYSFSIGNKLYDIDVETPRVRNIGRANESIAVYSTAGKNLISNGSFEQGTWQPKVDNCNSYDNSPNISQTIDTKNSTDEAKSLKLGASRHTACVTSAIINVIPNQNYRLTYHYNIHDGQRAGYDLIFNDRDKTILSAEQLNSQNNWHRLNITFAAPPGATEVKLRLKGYPDIHNQNYATTNYDQIKVTTLKRESEITKAYSPKYSKQNLGTDTSLSTNIVSKDYQYNNLIENPSIEASLWRNSVGDCNNYDDKPVLEMLQSNVANDGVRSLQLSATRHVACTGPKSITVKEGATYQLSFDYQSPNSKEGGYYVGFNDSENTNIGQRLEIKNARWQRFSQSIQVPYGATNMTLSVYSYANDYGTIKNINRYDNFSFVQIPDIANRYYLVSSPKEKLVEPKKITFELDSPTKKRVHIASATTGFYLNMSESYNSGWRLQLNDAKVAGLASWLPNAKPTAVPEEDHFKLNGFLNSWYVDPSALCKDPSNACARNADGSYDLEMVAEFTPQRYFYVGLIISGVTLGGCLAYLGYYTYRKYRTKPIKYELRKTK